MEAIRAHGGEPKRIGTVACATPRRRSGHVRRFVAPSDVSLAAPGATASAAGSTACRWVVGLVRSDVVNEYAARTICGLVHSLTPSLSS